MTSEERHLIVVIVNILTSLSIDILSEQARRDLFDAANAAGISYADLLDALRGQG